MGAMDEDALEQRTIYTVSQLNRQAKQLLETEFPDVWLEGEISNLAKPSSGHWYFTLKDPHAQLRCAMFRGQNRLLTFPVEDGTQVVVNGRLSLYEGRGDFQLIVNSMEQGGIGALKQAFDALKKKLQQQGLFAIEQKQPLPPFPKTIGVITSPTGAAIRDILRTLKRRFPSIPVIIYPAVVQGKMAAPSLVHALTKANQRQECDVLLLARGGGSMEDLWPFNEEIVAHALFNSKLPIITGIGHEIDFTIADFVADVRAPTPTAAAELASPDGLAWFHKINQQKQRLQREILNKIRQEAQRIDFLEKQLQDPRKKLQQQLQILNHLRHNLLRNWQHYLQRQQHQIAQLSWQLLAYPPTGQIDSLRQQITLLLQQLQFKMTHSLQGQQHRLASLATALENISPLATLARGYSLTTNQQGKLVVNAANCRKGEAIKVKLAKGHLDCEVTTIHEN